MTAEQNPDWGLLEFVGGPRDGELVADVTPIGNRREASGGYAVRTRPPHFSATDGWQIAEQQAIHQFGRGVPRYYSRMVWETQEPASASAAPSAPLPQDVQLRRLEQALLSGEDHEARLITSAFCAQTPSKTNLIEALLAPALRTIGSLWADGDISIYTEHRASAIVNGILGAHSANSTRLAAYRAAVVVLDAERHSLPSRMAAVALREDGWQVDELQGPTPVEVLEAAAVKRRLDLVVISSTYGGSFKQASDAKKHLEALGVPVLLGSPGATLYELQRLARRAVL